jgi:anti-sigma-K factor RskA
MNEEQHDLEALLGVYALDAVSDDERRAVEEFLIVDPRARREVAEHRDVASLLAWSGTAAPDGLWDRIAAQLDEPAPEMRGPLASVTSIDRPFGGSLASSDRSSRRRWLRSAGSWALASAAAAAVAVLVVTTVVNNRSDESPLATVVAAARADRDSRVASLLASDGTVVGEAIVDQDGHGYLVATALPALPDDRTYQLWGVIGDQVISLGVLGRAPEIEPFSVDAPVSQVVITNEVAGGVVSDGNPEGAYAAQLG